MRLVIAFSLFFAEIVRKKRRFLLEVYHHRNIDRQLESHIAAVEARQHAVIIEHLCADEDGNRFVQSVAIALC